MSSLHLGLMKPAARSMGSNVLFTSDLWKRALESYAGATHLTVKLYDANARVVFGPVHCTPLFRLFEEAGYDPGFFDECARQCLAQTENRPAVVVSEFHGLSVVGTSLLLEGKIVGAAVGGYAFVDFSQLSEVQRIARDAGIKFEEVWRVAREQKPVPKQRLTLNADLLQVLGDALLRENYRTRQHELAVLALQDAATEKDQAHHELQQTATALRDSEELLATELAATQQLQSASALLIEGGDAQALYQKIVDAAAAIMRSDMASLQMLNGFRGHEGELRLLAHRGFSPQAAAFWEWVRPSSESSCAEALNGGQRVVVGDVDKCDFMAGTADLETYREAGIRAVQSTPLLSRSGRLLGMVSTHWRKPHAPPESDLRQFDVLVRQAADLLERRQAEETLRESEERYRTLFDLGPVAIYSCDSSGVIRDYNRRAAELWGRTPERGDTDERFCGSFKLFRPDGSYMPHEQCPMADVVSGKVSEVHDGEVFIQRPDGSGVTVIVNIHPLKDKHGEVTGAINCFYDITERKQAEKALREAGERFRFMAESMPQKIFTATPSGDVDYFNRQWMDYTGLTFDEIKGWGWKQFIHPDDLEENVRTWQHSIETGEPFQFEHRFRRYDGAYHWHLSRAVPMRDSSGNITMWIGSNTDIQAVREQEERLRKTEKMAAAGQLAASMAHEVNNPLSSVVNALYLLEKHSSLDESARAYASAASSELERVVRIVKQSLSYYKVGSVARDLDLGQIVENSLLIFKERFQRIRIDVRQRIDTSAVMMGFGDELRQVVDNLLLNALEAMPNGGSLCVSVRESFDWSRGRQQRKGVRLTIADTGQGIPREYRERIFEPFFTTKAEKGTGLGLWILQGIVTKHDGVLSVRSSDIKGKSGTVFSIFLPSHPWTSRTSKHSKTEVAA